MSSYPHVMDAQCRPIVDIAALGAQFAALEVYFACLPSDFDARHLQIFLCSKNTASSWQALPILGVVPLPNGGYYLSFAAHEFSAARKYQFFDADAFTQRSAEAQWRILWRGQELRLRLLPPRISALDAFQEYAYRDIRYFLHSPNTSEQAAPLIICLHGGGEGGSGGEIHSPLLADKMAHWMFGADMQPYFPKAFVLVPQCPTYWLDNFVFNQRLCRAARNYTADLQTIIEQVLAFEPRIDRRRIYLIGASMGAYQSLLLLVAAPQYFAAAALACPAALPDAAEFSGNMPLWLVHAQGDTVAPIEPARQWAQSLQTRNYPLRSDFPAAVQVQNQAVNAHGVYLMMYENACFGHETGILEWLSQQRRRCD